tara:strand:+ start:408 stop:707 length:300 start_codon:yes stop_codon:yes gene_type:complete
MICEVLLRVVAYTQITPYKRRSPNRRTVMKEFSAKLLRSEVVHTGRVFTTVRDQIALPNGKQATLDIERHPASVILLPMPDNAHLVLVRQYRYAIDRWI